MSNEEDANEPRLDEAGNVRFENQDLMLGVPDKIEPEPKPQPDVRAIIFQLLRPQLDFDERRCFEHLQSLVRMGMLPPYPPPLNMPAEQFEAVCEDVLTKMAHIAEQVLGQEIPVGQVRVEIAPLEPSEDPEAGINPSGVKTDCGDV